MISVLAESNANQGAESDVVARLQRSCPVHREKEVRISSKVRINTTLCAFVDLISSKIDMDKIEKFPGLS